MNEYGKCIYRLALLLLLAACFCFFTIEEYFTFLIGVTTYAVRLEFCNRLEDGVPIWSVPVEERESGGMLCFTSNTTKDLLPV
jgi:hypothetical protein